MSNFQGLLGEPSEALASLAVPGFDTQVSEGSHVPLLQHQRPMSARDAKRKPNRNDFLHKHSLSIATGLILATWIILYIRSDAETHWGSFFGNAVADWTGLLITVLATKYFYEIGSPESRRPPHRLLRPIARLLEDHSLTLFLIVTGAVWIRLFVTSDPTSKWGQVVGNIVSEWTQILGMVVLTKHLLESHSKESRR